MPSLITLNRRKEEKLPCRDLDSFRGFQLQNERLAPRCAVSDPITITSLPSLPSLEQLILFKVHLSGAPSLSLCLSLCGLKTRGKAAAGHRHYISLQ